jgi:hypothetical protein
MISMAWVLTNSKQYIYIDHMSRITTTPKLDQAKVFEHRAVAEKFLKTLPKKMRQMGFHSSPLSETVGAAESVVVNRDLLDPEYYLKSIQAFRNFIESIGSQKSVLEDGRRTAELAIEDILHAIEFNDLTEEQCVQFCRSIHDARVQRRQCKNAIAWIQFVMDAQPEAFLQNDPSPRIAGTKTRCYAPRVLPELFEDLDGVAHQQRVNGK